MVSVAVRILLKTLCGLSCCVLLILTVTASYYTPSFNVKIQAIDESTGVIEFHCSTLHHVTLISTPGQNLEGIEESIFSDAKVQVLDDGSWDLLLSKENGEQRRFPLQSLQLR
jgi:hypothetical protein